MTVELRKKNRDETLIKKRQIEGLTADSTDDEDLRENLSTASLDTIVEKARSSEPATQLLAVQAARKLLSSDRCLPPFVAMSMSSSCVGFPLGTGYPVPGTSGTVEPEPGNWTGYPVPILKYKISNFM